MKKEMQSLENVRCFTTETEKELYEIMGGRKWFPTEVVITPDGKILDPGNFARPCYGVIPKLELAVKE